MSIFRRGDTWWLYIVHAGRRIRRSCDTDNRAVAKRVHDELRAELHRHRPSGRTFYGALETWRKAGKRDSADEYRLTKFKKLYPDRPLHSVTADTLRAAIPNTSSGTFNRYANLITAALNLAKLELDPPLERQETPEGRVRWLTREEWGELRKHLPDHQLVMATFALSTGLRQSNVFNLEWSQVDMTRRVAWIHADQAKARKAIAVPLSGDALSVLRAQEGQHARWVFPLNGRPITEIKTGWKVACRRAGVRDFTWHGLRHTWATWHIMGGTPLEVLQKLGGWADVRMVLKYTHFAPGYLAQYANNAKPVSTSSTTPQKHATVRAK